MQHHKNKRASHDALKELTLEHPDYHIPPGVLAADQHKMEQSLLENVRKHGACNLNAEIEGLNTVISHVESAIQDLTERASSGESDAETGPYPDDPTTGELILDSAELLSGLNRTLRAKRATAHRMLASYHARGHDEQGGWFDTDPLEHYAKSVDERKRVFLVRLKIFASIHIEGMRSLAGGHLIRHHEDVRIASPVQRFMRERSISKKRELFRAMGEDSPKEFADVDVSNTVSKATRDIEPPPGLPRANSLAHLANLLQIRDAESTEVFARKLFWTIHVLDFFEPGWYTTVLSKTGEAK